MRSEWVRRGAWIGVLIVGLVLFELIRQAIIRTDNPIYVPSLIVLGAGVIPAAFVTFISGLGLRFSVGGGLVFAVAVVGGVVGTVIAGILEYDTIKRLGPFGMLGVGFIEESAKLLPCVVVLLVVLRHRNSPANGLLVGVAAGAGFAALETMGCAFVELIQPQGNLSVLDQVLLQRGAMSPAAHMAWTGLTSAALWHAAERGWTRPAVVSLLGVFLVAVGLHAAWDTIGSTTGYVLVAAISLALLTATTGRLARAQRDADRLSSARPVLQTP